MVKNPLANSGDMGLNPGSGRSPEEGKIVKTTIKKLNSEGKKCKDVKYDLKKYKMLGKGIKM